MRTPFLILSAVLFLAGCATTPAPQAASETFIEQMDREHRERESHAQADQVKQDKERADYVAAHEELKPAIRDAILNRQVVIGMTYEQAIKSLGAGHDFHSAVTANGRADQFTYRDMNLIFVNGVLTEIDR